MNILECTCTNKGSYDVTRIYNLTRPPLDMWSMADQIGTVHCTTLSGLLTPRKFLDSFVHSKDMSPNGVSCYILKYS